MSHIAKKIDPASIEESIQELNEYINDVNIKPVLSVLEALKIDPDNKSLAVELVDSLDSVGVMKGAILTYAPYIAVLVSNGLFDDD